MSLSQRPQYIAHVDANSAYLSWSAAEHLRRGGTLDYRTIPSVVGGDPKTRHGIVLAKSIPAKAYGIKTAELIWQACQKCPGLLVIPGDFEIYSRYSKAMVNILREYSDRVYVYSIDECFIDLTGMELLFGDPLTLVDTIRNRIRDELGFTVSVGISSNMLLAKIASDMRKPDATTTLFPDEIPAKLWPMPVEDMFMCGPASTKKLNQLGIYTVGHLAGTKPETMRQHLKSYGVMLWNYAHGISSNIVGGFKARDTPQSIGNSSVISFDVSTRKEASLIILALAESVSMRMREQHLVGHVISLSFRDIQFNGRQHQRRYPQALATVNEIHRGALQLLDELWQQDIPLRQFGLRMSMLEQRSDFQQSLFPEIDKYENAEEAVFRIRKRYGKTSVFRAGFLGSRIKPIIGHSFHDEEETIPVFAQTPFASGA